MFFPKNSDTIKARYLKDRKTKALLTRIKAGNIAVISHSDIDEIAAIGLIEKKVRAVINFSTSMTGKYPTIGLKKLYRHHIPVFDAIESKDVFSQLNKNSECIIDKSKGFVQFIDDEIELPIKEWTLKDIDKIMEIANNNIENELNRFIDNTLDFASREKDFVLKPLDIPQIKTKIKGRHVVVVVRGNNYREDLLAIRSYIEDYKPVLIGVDGGADALLEYNLKPDIIIGDMDSVSDKALASEAEIIVHGYPDGRAPGKARIERIGKKADVIPALGTSEDVAMLMAYELKAEIIVALGAHSNMIDFLEKGRKGMASTVLVRMKIGTKLIDAKGVSKLYQPRTDLKAISFMGLAAVTPIVAISLINHDMVRLLEMMWINIKMLFT